MSSAFTSDIESEIKWLTEALQIACGNVPFPSEVLINSTLADAAFLHKAILGPLSAFKLVKNDVAKHSSSMIRSIDHSFRPMRWVMPPVHLPAVWEIDHAWGTKDHRRDARATNLHGQDARATRLDYFFFLFASFSGPSIFS